MKLADAAVTFEGIDGEEPVATGLEVSGDVVRGYDCGGEVAEVHIRNARVEEIEEADATLVALHPNGPMFGIDKPATGHADTPIHLHSEDGEAFLPLITDPARLVDESVCPPSHEENDTGVPCTRWAFVAGGDVNESLVLAFVGHGDHQ